MKTKLLYLNFAMCYNYFNKLEFVGACNEPNRINSQERYFTNI